MKVAVLSDVHANIHALRAVLEDLDKERVERVLVAGDIIGYYYWPSEVVEVLMGDGRFHCISGNHEHILRQVMNDEDAAMHYRRKYGSGYDVCMAQLSDLQINWLLSLPEEISVNINGLQFHIGHGALGSSDEYLYPDAPLDKILSNYSTAEYTIFGHTHYPFLHSHAGQHLLNPGSVGQPRDMGGLASYVVINSENRVVRFKRKPFDTAVVMQAARENDPELAYLAAIMSR